jgi:hypothetical protein
MRRIKRRTSADIAGRPTVLDFQRENRRNAARCQPINVAGLTITKALRQSKKRASLDKTNRSAAVVGTASGGQVRVASGPGCPQRERGADAYGVGKLLFLRSMGVKAGEDLPKDPEKSVTVKADVVRWCKVSFEPVEENYPKIDKQKAAKFLGHDATGEGVLLRALAHANEDLGEMIAYARVNGVVPPWQ